MAQDLCEANEPYLAKKEAILQKFDLLADTQGAINRFRKLVLELAVTGRLIPDSPTCDNFVPLGNLATFINGDRSKNYPSKAYRVKEGVPFVNAGHLQNGDVSLLEMDYITEEHFERLGSGKIQHNDVLFCLRGSLGKCAVVRSIKQGAIASSLLIIRPSGEILSDFLYIVLTSPIGEKSIREFDNGSAQPNLSATNVKKFKIPCPPLAEQKRIVAKVDELMGLCDRLEAEQAERQTRHAALSRAALARFADEPTVENLRFLFHESFDISPAELRKTVLALAVSGRLVPFQAEIGKSVVGDHVKFQNGYAFKSGWFQSEGIRLCRNANVGHGKLDWREAVYVDQERANEFERFRLSEGDIVLSLDRPLISTGLKVARIQSDDLPCLLLQRVARPVPLHGNVDLDYFLLWLNSPAFIDSIDPGRSNGVPHISTRQVEKLCFHLPTLDEQRLIVAQVNQLLALVDDLEQQLIESQDKAEQLMEAVVAELVRQN